MKAFDGGKVVKLLMVELTKRVEVVELYGGGNERQIAL